MKRIQSTVRADVVVAGGGMSGICAAIASARAGAKTILVQNRPALGGNASSEIRVWMTGAVGESTHSSVRFAQEMGIIGELQMENLRYNPLGNPYLWDEILLASVKRQENLRLFLNTEIMDVLVDHNVIRAIRGMQIGSEQAYLFKGTQFIDCTGDGSIGFLAGADFARGREDREAYGEPHAQAVADDLTLGSTLLFYTRDAGTEVAFSPPDFSYTREEIKALFERTGKHISLDMTGCDLWWIEYGGLRDTITDNEDIRDELWRLVYGVWDYIKNSGIFDAGRLTLDWVGAIPGKRESRRLLGPRVLTERDIERFVPLKDGVCYGGSPIDPHPPEGIYSTRPSNDNFLLEGVYQIPLGCLYSRNIDNLFFAGRLLSVSHVALCSIRVMKTCALSGQAAGEGAAMAALSEKAPSAFDRTDVRMIQQRLLREDCWIPGLRNEDKADLAKGARVEASGHREACLSTRSGLLPLDEDVWFFLPPATKEGALEIPFVADSEGALRAELCATPSLWNYRELDTLASFETRFMAGNHSLRILVQPSDNRLSCVHFSPAKGAMLVRCDECLTGFFAVKGELTGHRLSNLCFTTDAFADLYVPEHVIDGYSRPWGKPSLWISAPLSKGQCRLDLALRETTDVRTIILYLNPDLMRGLIHIQSPDLRGMGWDKMPPTLLKDFDVYTLTENGDEIKIAGVRENWRRMVSLMVYAPATRKIRIRPLATWGGSCAEIFEVRVYGTEKGGGRCS